MGQQPIMVAMAEIHVRRGPAVFSCIGLGSCIGVAAVDPVADVAGMVHIMLPESFRDKPNEAPGKFADTGIPELIAMMTSNGALASRILIAICGGAQVFKFGNGSNSRMDIGGRNISAVQTQLKAMKFTPIGEDTGGSLGRTMILESATGEVRVRTIGRSERVLCTLRRENLARAC